jgi:GNAT superfamily N-acetyltransferase
MGVRSRSARSVPRTAKVCTRRSRNSARGRFTVASSGSGANFLDIDFVNHVALVVVADDGGEPTIVGGGRYVVVQPGQAEVAFAIIDTCQGLGIGSTLMRHLATLRREAGLHEFTAEVLSENVPMLNVFERSGLAMSTERDGTVMHVTLRLA